MITNYLYELSLTENTKPSFPTKRTNIDTRWDVDENEGFWGWDNNPETVDLT